MIVFVDTSALYAILDRTDPSHQRAIAAMSTLAGSSSQLVTHAYVVSESIALVHRRLGWAALDALLDDLMPLIDIRWIDTDLHGAALAGMRASRSRVSFVDWVSFTLMRRERIDSAFAFDADFGNQGLTLIA